MSSSDVQFQARVRKSLIGCGAGGLVGAAALMFLFPSLLEMGLWQMVSGAFTWAAHLVGSIVTWALTTFPNILAFLFLSVVLCGICLAIKLRNEISEESLGHIILLVIAGFVGFSVMMISHLELRINRTGVFALGDTNSQAVAAYDAMTVEESRAYGSEAPWQMRKFQESTSANGVSEDYFGPPNCRRAVKGYQASPAMGRYRMEIGGTTVTQATDPSAACPALRMTKITLHKLD